MDKLKDKPQRIKKLSEQIEILVTGERFGNEHQGLLPSKQNTVGKRKAMQERTCNHGLHRLRGH